MNIIELYKQAKTKQEVEALHIFLNMMLKLKQQYYIRQSFNKE